MAIDIPKAMALIKEAIDDQIPLLRILSHDNKSFKVWYKKTKNILKAAFGEDSDEYNEFVQLGIPTGAFGEKWRLKEEYIAYLDAYEVVLRSIFETYEAIGTWVAPETGQVQAPEDSAHMASYLFDKMQFHPKVIDAGKSLFETGHYAQAILEAFKAVNNFVKQKTGSSLEGKQLMAQVFDEDGPIVRINELRTTSQRNEQEGFKFLFMGAMVGVRNPKAHDDVVQEDPYRTLEYLGFASLLMKRIEEGEVKRPRKKRAKSPKSS